MKWETEQLNTIDAWIVGSKIKEEKIFFHQIVYKLALKQKLWEHFNNNNMDYFFLEIKLPCTINTDNVPF